MLFNRSSSLLLVLCGLPLLFFPKINLVSFGNSETAGIRLDDMVLFLMCLLFFWAHFSLQKSINKMELLILAIVCFSVLSFTLNRLLVSQGWLHNNASIFYCLRIAEYFIFFYLGAMSVNFFGTSPIIRAFFLWNLVTMILQWAGLVGQFTMGGYVSSTFGRVVGISSFPSEAGMVINLLFCYLVFDERKRKSFFRLPLTLRVFFEHTYIYWLFLICCALVIMTGSRIAIIAIIVAFLFRVKQELKKRSIAPWIYALTFLSIGAALTVTMIQNTDSVIVRSEKLFSLKNIQLVEMVWDKVNIAQDPINEEEIQFDVYDNYDMSWWLRIHKWIFAIKTYCLNPWCWLQGIGPGYAMAALDGGWLRILTENGLIGLILFVQLLAVIARFSPQLRWMVIAFGINMIFFDVYLAYKPMSLLFFVSGCGWAKSRALIPFPESPVEIKI